MSSSSSVSSSTLVRLSGLSSGLDTDSIVKSLLQVDQTKVDKEYKLKTKLEWTGDALRAVNLEIKNFREKYMSVLSSSTNMFTSSAYNAYTVTMGSATNAVSVTAGSAATAGSYTINSITQLATAGSVSGVGMFSSDSIGAASKLSEAFGDSTFDSDGNISFSINGKAFTFSKDTTISSMMSTINSDTTANVTMSFSSLKKGFSIASKSTGASSSVVISNISGNAFASSADSAAFKIAEGTYTGQNAKATIEGVAVEKSSNTFTIDGITYSLKATTSSAVSFSVDRDTDAVYKKISDFIDSYNTLVSDLQAKLDEKVYSDYGPLTDAEREKLSDTQAEQWETKAKSGLLSDDSNIRSLLTNLRSAFYTAVSGAGKSASDIGLNTQAYATTGKIVIDEAKLKTALANNPDMVAKVFTNVSTATDASTKNKESGLITRISSLLNNYITTSTDVTLAQNTIQINQASDKLDELNDWLSNNEEKYYAKFTAMESALAKLNSQSGWLSSLMGSSSSS